MAAAEDLATVVKLFFSVRNTTESCEISHIKYENYDVNESELQELLRTRMSNVIDAMNPDFMKTLLCAEDLSHVYDKALQGEMKRLNLQGPLEKQAPRELMIAILAQPMVKTPRVVELRGLKNVELWDQALQVCYGKNQTSMSPDENSQCTKRILGNKFNGDFKAEKEKVIEVLVHEEALRGPCALKIEIIELVSRNSASKPVRVRYIHIYIYTYIHIYI